MEELINKYRRGELTLAELADMLGSVCIQRGEMNGAAGLMYISLCLDKEMEEKYKNELLEIASYMGEEI